MQLIKMGWDLEMQEQFLIHDFKMLILAVAEIYFTI